MAEYFYSVDPDVAITMIKNGEEKDQKTRLTEGKNRRKGKTEGKQSQYKGDCRRKGMNVVLNVRLVMVCTVTHTHTQIFLFHLT